MKYLTKRITFQEVPDEISLSFLVTGCPMKCKWCHTPEARNWMLWEELTKDKLIELIKESKWISCVLFLWWDWHRDELIEMLDLVISMWLKTALYTSMELDEVDSFLLANLNYIKTWPYKFDLGGLSSLSTNQRMYNLDTQEDITYLFHKNK